MNLYRDMGLLGTFYRCWIYRPLMRFIHALGYCDMQAMPRIEVNERPRFWCQWCGMHGTK